MPKLQEFVPRFIDGYARANRHKPSGIAGKEAVLRVHLILALGAKRLDAISSEDVARLKSRLVAKAPKTVNNVLTVLNVLLKTAVEWNVLDQMEIVGPTMMHELVAWVDSERNDRGY